MQSFSTVRIKGISFEFLFLLCRNTRQMVYIFLVKDNDDNIIRHIKIFPLLIFLQVPNRLMKNSVLRKTFVGLPAPLGFYHALS